MAAQYGEYSVHGISSLGHFALRVTYAVSLAGNGLPGLRIADGGDKPEITAC